MTFGKLSECLDDEYAKVLYIRACYAVHAGAMGDVALLGRPQTNSIYLYSGGTYNGAATPLELAVSSLANITEILFEQFGTSSPVSSKEFLSLLQTYIENNHEEIEEQQNA